MGARSEHSSLRRSIADAPAFDEVYRQHSRPVLVFLTRRTCDPEVALDLTAETFAQAFQARRRFRGSSPEAERAWLLGIARHLYARYVRKGVAESRAVRRLGLQLPRASEADHARVLEIAGLADLRAAVAEELHALNDDQQRAVQLRIIDELSYSVIASRLGISEQTVRARVSRGLRTIADELQHRQLAHEPETA